tara:strand:- start:302 stop:466 length:165 start_codon:yes stop_codon:yes gene_type:complete
MRASNIFIQYPIFTFLGFLTDGPADLDVPIFDVPIFFTGDFFLPLPFLDAFPHV